MQCVSWCSREMGMGCVINWKLMGADGQKVHSFHHPKKKRIVHWELFSFGFFLTSFIMSFLGRTDECWKHLLLECANLTKS